MNSETDEAGANKLDVTALSAWLTPHDGVSATGLMLHFRHPITDADRANLIEAVNMFNNRPLTPSGAGEGEPVAWRTGSDSVTLNKSVAEYMRRVQGAEVQPLYLRPTQSQEGVKAVIEAATIEIERLRYLHCTRREAFEIVSDDAKAALVSDFVRQLAGLRETITALTPQEGGE